MTSVTYKNQPGIHKTRGSVPVNGTDHTYTVHKVLWYPEIEAWIAERLISPTLHVCCGMSQLGDIRVDLFANGVDVVADAARLPFADKSVNTVLIDPPYNGKFQWNHDMLNELHRIARKRIIFQHWYIPANRNNEFKKANVFKLTEQAIAPVVSAEFEPAVIVRDGTDIFYVEEDQGSAFNLTETYLWQPRTYFGRVQILSVFTLGES